MGRLGRVLGRLGRILERLGGVLEASWSVLGASWGVLGRKIGFPWVLKRKKSERAPGSQLHLAAGNTPNIKDEELYCRKTTLQTSTDHLTTHADTQLGAFGPGADIHRAAELRTRHRA